jgi:hypothetical protein
MIMADLPNERTNFCKNFATAIRSSTSKNADGSSRAYKSAFCNRHDAIATFCSSPPDKFFTDLLYNFFNFNGSKICSSSVLPSIEEPFDFSKTEITSTSISFERYCGLYEILIFLSTEPSVGFSTPAIIFIIVVFPNALAPIIPSSSPFLTVPGSIETENESYFFSNLGYEMTVSPSNISSPDVDASKVNFLSLNLTFSAGK